MHTSAFTAVYSGEQVWPVGLLFIKTSAVKQYSYQNDFGGVFDAVHQSFLVHIAFPSCIVTTTGNVSMRRFFELTMIEFLYQIKLVGLGSVYKNKTRMSTF